MTIWYSHMTPRTRLRLVIAFSAVSAAVFLKTRLTERDGSSSTDSLHLKAVWHADSKGNAIQESRGEVPAAADLGEAFSLALRQVRQLTGPESLLPHNDGTFYFANNPGQRLTSRFQADGVLVGSAREGREMKISRRGAEPALISAKGTRATYQRPDGSQEWFENAEGGIEHGMTLAHRPEGAGDLVRMEFSVSGMQVATGEDGLVMKDDAGAGGYGYRNLKAWDANGRTLDARLEPAAGGFSWIIDDRNAAYPVTIDPLIVNLEDLPDGPVGDANSGFGGNVDVDGDTAVVGAQTETTAVGTNAGAVYVFKRTAGVWSQEARLQSLDPAQEEQFGTAVAVDGDDIAVGVGFDNNPVNGATVQLFHRSAASWPWAGRITPPAPSYSFGNILAMDGGTLVVGQPNATPPGGPTAAGTALVYQVNAGSWSGPQEIAASTGAAQDQFGCAVAIQDGRIAIGARACSVGGIPGAGAVYVFQGGGSFWNQLAKLTAGDPRAYDQLGDCVAIDSGRVIAGAPYQSRAGLQDGAAYVFSSLAGTWVQEAKLAAPDAPNLNIGFGNSVAIAGNHLVVTTTYFKAYGGHVLLYERVGRTWLRRASLATDNAVDTRFASVAMDGTTLVAGFPFYSNQGGSAAAYSIGNSSPAQEIAVFTGPGDALQETLSGAPVNFGTAYLNENQTWPVTIFNDGTAMLEVTAAELLAGASDGLAVDPIGILPGLTLSPGESAQVMVRTFFSSTGAKSGTLRLTNNDTNEGSFDVPLSFNVIQRPAPLGLTITREAGIPVLRYPHLQFFQYQVERSTNLSDWLPIGNMQTEFDIPTTTQMKVFRDSTPPSGKAFYRVIVN